MSDQIIIFKNWRVYFSSVLGYVRFHQPHDNKKLWFTITCWTNWKQGASNRVASCYLELLDQLQKRICKTVDSSLATSLELLADRLNVASLSLFCRYYFGRCSSELAQLVPLPYSQGRSTCYSDRLHDLSVTIPRCYKDVYVNSFCPGRARL